MNDPWRLLGYVLYGLYVAGSLWLFLNAMVQLHLLWHFKRRRRKTVAAGQLPDLLPFISIQLPVYNEKYVVAGLLQCMGKLHYPKDRFEIQVLDDSTDETSAIVDREIAALRMQKISATVVRRTDRCGFKAGALQYGLSFCKGELIAIFDADFRPHPDFLKRLLPHFSETEVGLVQAKWAHLNRDENALTRIQTFLLDTHFSVEQAGRAKAGYFINFCGTAGIWSRQCIEDAGGWDGSVLSEDLDISYRAQLKGWKLVYDPSTEVPAELPSVMEAFRVQQFRWTKGMAQITRKNLRLVLRAPLPFAKKLHGVFHLLSSFVFVCLLVNAALTVPLLIYRNLYPDFITLMEYTLVSSINLVALTLFYYQGTKTGLQVSFFRHYPLFLVVYMALSVQNAVAVVQGLTGRNSAFVRTPKFNRQRKNDSYLYHRFTWINRVELFLFFYFMAGIIISIYLNDYFLMLFFVMMTYGLGFILSQTLSWPLQKQQVPVPATAASGHVRTIRSMIHPKELHRSIQE